LGESLLECDIDAFIVTTKGAWCNLKKNCKVSFNEGIGIKKKLDPQFSENVAKFKEKVKDIT
jgi:hypothetical protein